LKIKTEQTPTLEQFQELNSIALPGEALNFNNLKQEIKRLKIKDFNPYFQEKKDNFAQLVTNAQNQAGEGLKTILDLFLETKRQLLEQTDNDLLVQGRLEGQLTTCQTLLLTKFAERELQELLNRQKELLKLEKQATSLQQNQEQFQANIRQV
jgi:hypothetical protein